MCTQTAYPVIDLAETGRRIERQRREAGLTVRDLQAYFGFEYPQAIYKWQHGECLPTVDNLLALARLLRVSMEDLLVYEDRGVSPLFRGVLVRTVSGGSRKRIRFRKRTRLPAGQSEAPALSLKTVRKTVQIFEKTVEYSCLFMIN